jgi:hypothetical protein
MTNRIRGNLFRSLPLLSLANSGAALVRERMTTANHLLAAPPHVRLKAMLQPGAQEPLEGAGELPVSVAGDLIGAEYPGLTTMDDPEMPSNGGEE